MPRGSALNSYSWLGSQVAKTGKAIRITSLIRSVTMKGRDDGPPPRRLGALEQRRQLDGERAAAEGVLLDHQGVGRHGREGLEQVPAAGGPELVGRRFARGVE